MTNEEKCGRRNLLFISSQQLGTPGQHLLAVLGLQGNSCHFLASKLPVFWAFLLKQVLPQTQSCICKISRRFSIKKVQLEEAQACVRASDRALPTAQSHSLLGPGTTLPPAPGSCRTCWFLQEPGSSGNAFCQLCSQKDSSRFRGTLAVLTVISTRTQSEATVLGPQRSVCWNFHQLLDSDRLLRP